MPSIRVKQVLGSVSKESFDLPFLKRIELRSVIKPLIIYIYLYYVNIGIITTFIDPISYGICLTDLKTRRYYRAR